MGVMLTHPGIRAIKADITVEDVERIRQFLMPNVPDKMDEVIQPLIPQPIHTIPPNDDYVAPATESILDELLEEFGDEIVNVTMVDEEAAEDPQSHFTEIQVDVREWCLVDTWLPPCDFGDGSTIKPSKYKVVEYKAVVAYYKPPSEEWVSMLHKISLLATLL
ncbi:hypothetical protein Tco_1531315 [Tanacetum coccineum]